MYTRHALVHHWLSCFCSHPFTHVYTAYMHTHSHKHTYRHTDIDCIHCIHPHTTSILVPHYIMTWLLTWFRQHIILFHEAMYFVWIKSLHNKTVNLNYGKIHLHTTHSHTNVILWNCLFCIKVKKCHIVFVCYVFLWKMCIVKIIKYIIT